MKSAIYNPIYVPATVGTDPLIQRILEASEDGNEYILICTEGYKIDIPQESVLRMIQVARDTGARILYSDYREQLPDGSVRPHPLADYQAGSVRDDFDFGPAILFRAIPVIFDTTEYSGLYALRLAIAAVSPDAIVHLREPLYTSSVADNRASGEKQFDYVNPRNAAVQREREEVFTNYLKTIGAYLPERELLINPQEGSFPVEASVIIPVRDRAVTIADAVNSSLAQQTDFPFNVIVIDNHSTDGTTEILSDIAAKNPKVVHLIPGSDTLGIGGCWELGVNNSQCGRYAVQLDSDDKYKDAHTLQKIVDCFRREKCAMVIGSYELTDFDGNPIPPGLIDHKEWTAENGHNNALRINGLGAPRAFFTPVLREIGVPNVSYGEDYALGLRISRRYRIGRIFESLYLCRRWGGNSDAALSQERINANNTYKDLIRTIEISARKQIVAREMPEDLRMQLQMWDLARDNYAALDNVLKKKIVLKGKTFTVLYNPARKVSTGAKLSKKDIEARPCFLCEQNRPKEQMQEEIVPGYVKLINPYPVFSPHYTIASEWHQPQSIVGCEPDGTPRIVSMMRIALTMPDMTVFYNGPKSGASAPDHMHFQAVPQSRFNPFDGEPLPLASISFTARSGMEAIGKFRMIMESLMKRSENAGLDEPRVNVFMRAIPQEMQFYDGPGVQVLIVPRRAHRPGFYGEGEGQMLLSPGAIDVGGTIITVRKEDFDNISPEILARLLSQTVHFSKES